METTGKIHVLIVGVKETLSHHNSLKYAESDAKNFEYLYRKITPSQTNIITLCNQDNEQTKPTKDNLLNTIEELKTTVEENDTVIVCVQSHGEKNLENNRENFYFILADTELNSENQTNFDTALEGNLFLEKLSELKAKNIILFVDSCYSGALNFPDNIKSNIPKGKKYFFIVSSSSENYISFYYDSFKSSIFNYSKMKTFENLLQNNLLENNTTVKEIDLRSIIGNMKEEIEKSHQKIKSEYDVNSSLADAGVKKQNLEVKEINNNQIESPIIGYHLSDISQSLYYRKSLIISSQDTSHLKQILQTKCGFENISNNIQGSVEDIINKTIEKAQTSLFYFDCIFDAQSQDFTLNIKNNPFPFKRFKSILQKNKENNPVQNFIVFLDIDNQNNHEQQTIKNKIKELKFEINICLIAYNNQDNNNSLKDWILKILNPKQKDNSDNQETFNHQEKGLTAAQFIRLLQEKSENKIIPLLVGLNNIIEIVLDPEKQEHYGTILNWRKNAKNMLPKINKTILHKDVNIFDIYVERTLEEKYLTQESNAKQEQKNNGSLTKEETDNKSESSMQIKKITEKQLLQEITFKKENNRNENQSNKIQIIGDAGSGKSIFLLKLFYYIFNNDSLYIPLYISLTDYSNWAKEETAPNKSDFKNYILEKFLPNIAEILPRTNDEIIKKNQRLLQDYINKGYVFFFLDGSNEIADSKVINLINTIQTDSFFSNAHIIFSSRINMFNNNDKKTREFKSYSLCPFKENEIHFFIHKFFEKDSAKAQGLLKLLNGDNQDIKSLVENPLFLTLVCVCNLWEQGENKLSSIKNKNQLYQKFLNRFFESQPDIFESQADTRNHTLTKRVIHDIKQVLRTIAKLALEDSKQGFTIILNQSNIDEKLSKFDSISKLKTPLGNTDEEGTILWWIVKLEWLIIEDKSQDTFKFNHPSFQEYFAATAIDDGDYFLPSEHKKKPIKHKEYRIFDRTWKEVILFWLGAEAEEEKREEFMQRLVTFQDATGKYQFYKIRAYLLALRGLLEFPNFSRAEEIIKNVFEFNLSLRRNLFESNSLWNYKKITPKFIKREILEILSEIQPVLITKSSILEKDIIENLRDGLNQQELIMSNFYYLPDFIFNEYAIETLGKVKINIIPNLLIRLFNIFSNSSQQPFNDSRYYYESFRSNIVETLAKRFVDVPQEFWINALNNPDSDIRQFTSLTLKNVNEPSVIDILIPFLLKKDRGIYANILYKLSYVLETEKSKDVIEKVVESLINALSYHSNDSFITWRIANTLGETASPEKNSSNSSFICEFIRNILEDEEKKSAITEALQYAVNNNPHYRYNIQKYWQELGIHLIYKEEEQNLAKIASIEDEYVRYIYKKYNNFTTPIKHQNDIEFLAQLIIDTNYYSGFPLLFLKYLIQNISDEVILVLIKILQNNNNEKINWELRQIIHYKLAETKSDKLIDELVEVLKKCLKSPQNYSFSSFLAEGYIGKDAIKILGKIKKSSTVTKKLIELLNLLNYEVFFEQWREETAIEKFIGLWIIEELSDRELSNRDLDEFTRVIVNFIYYIWDNITTFTSDLTVLKASVYLINEVKNKKYLQSIVYNYNNKINKKNRNQYFEVRNYEIYSTRIIWHCATNLSYSDFYEALHNLPNYRNQ